MIKISGVLMSSVDDKYAGHSIRVAASDMLTNSLIKSGGLLVFADDPIDGDKGVEFSRRLIGRVSDMAVVTVKGGVEVRVTADIPESEYFGLLNLLDSDIHNGRFSFGGNASLPVPVRGGAPSFVRVVKLGDEDPYDLALDVVDER